MREMMRCGAGTGCPATREVTEMTKRTEFTTKERRERRRTKGFFFDVNEDGRPVKQL
jgi:hypothetical protein